jgi:hypothetical protein
MAAGKSVLIIGFEPTFLNYSTIPDLDAAKVMAAVKADEAQLLGLGYEVELRLIDLGETAETVVRDRPRQKQFDCILIGAGVRTIPKYSSCLKS